MEQSAVKELCDPNTYPSDSVLEGILGASYGAYQELLKRYERSGLNAEWRYYKDGKAWLCKVHVKSRTIVWMSAWKGYMQATIYIPEKHIPGIYGLPVSRETLERITAAANTGKSKPCTFRITGEDVLDDFECVMQFKLAAK
jgi:hypothetical protein